MKLPVVLKTKYAFHALLWLLEPDLVLDIGSQDGADSKRFRKLLPQAELVAFEGNPGHIDAMREDAEIGRRRIRVVHSLVSETQGKRSFFLQRPVAGAQHFNRGTSSLTRRDENEAIAEEVLLDSVRIETFLAREYPKSLNVALWLDAEGHTYSVLEGMSGTRDQVKLVHAEVETSEIWPKQKIEADVLRLAASMDLVPIAHGADALQRDLILAKQGWYEANRFRIHCMLQLCRCSGPALSRFLGWWASSRRGSRAGARVEYPAPGAASTPALAREAAETMRPERKRASLQVFVLCRNRPDFARQAIQSAMRQTVNRFEIVITDNSTDSSVESLVRSEFPHLKYRRRTSDLSVFDHLNQCLTEATADYVCLFHDDDLLSPRYMECVLEAIDQFPDAAAIGTNAWIAEDGTPPQLSIETLGKTLFVHDSKQLAEHYFSRHQPGFAPFPGYVYSTARTGELKFNPSGGKYSDVSWLLSVADRGGIVWIVEPLMTTRMHESNDSRQESIGDRLKLFAFFKKHESTLGEGLIEDFRFFLYKKVLELNGKNLRPLSPSRRRTVEAYLTRYRFRRISRLDHHRFLLQKAKVRLVQRVRPRTFNDPHGEA